MEPPSLGGGGGGGRLGRGGEGGLGTRAEGGLLASGEDLATLSGIPEEVFFRGAGAEGSSKKGADFPPWVDFHQDHIRFHPQPD